MTNADCNVNMMKERIGYYSGPFETRPAVLNWLSYSAKWGLRRDSPVGGKGGEPLAYAALCLPEASMQIAGHQYLARQACLEEGQRLH